jgi:replicative DNA helicase
VSPLEIPSRIPPHNLDAERAVLGAMLLEGREAVPRAIEVLRPSDFYTEAHRAIYDTMLRLFDRGEPVDLITLSEELRRTDQLTFVGGPAALALLVEQASIAAHLMSYASIVRDMAVLRELIQTSTQIITQAFDAKEEVQTVVDDAERRIFSLAERRLEGHALPVGRILKDTFEHIEKLYERKEHVTGVATGFEKLDLETSGFQPSDFIIIAARPSMGKTAFALNIAQHVGVHLRQKVLFLSLEMSAQQLVQRMLCSEAKVDSQAVRTGYLTSADWHRLTAAAGRLAEAAIFIDDSAGLTVLEARAKARRIKAEHGLDLVVIDYLQLMRGRASLENRQQEISDISRSLKALAKELNVPVVALSQLSRAVEARAHRDFRPQLSDLRECVTGDTLVMLADGRRIPIADLVGAAPEVLAVDEAGEVVAAKSELIWCVGRKSVKRLRLASGRVLRATEQHRLLTANGWSPLGGIRVGHRVGVAHRIPEPRFLAARRHFPETVGAFGPGAAQPRLDDHALRARVRDDLFWDRVVAIDDAAESDVFDITVPGPASWLADGIVSHNSGALEQDADLILFLYRPRMYKDDVPPEEEKIAELIIGKQRNGPVGTIKVIFLPEYARYENVADSHRQPQPF